VGGGVKAAARREGATPARAPAADRGAKKKGRKPKEKRRRKEEAG